HGGLPHPQGSQPHRAGFALRIAFSAFFQDHNGRASESATSSPRPGAARTGAAKGYCFSAHTAAGDLRSGQVWLRYFTRFCLQPGAPGERQNTGPVLRRNRRSREKGRRLRRQGAPKGRLVSPKRCRNAANQLSLPRTKPKLSPAKWDASHFPEKFRPIDILPKRRCYGLVTPMGSMKNPISVLRVALCLA